MKAILKEPGKEPRILEVESDHEALHEALGGYLEHIGIGRGIGILCDEDGRYKGPVVKGRPTSLPYNFSLPDIGPLVGPVLFVGESPDGFIGLDDEQISLVFDGFEEMDGDHYAK